MVLRLHGLRHCSSRSYRDWVLTHGPEKFEIPQNRIFRLAFPQKVPQQPYIFSANSAYSVSPALSRTAQMI